MYVLEYIDYMSLYIYIYIYMQVLHYMSIGLLCIYIYVLEYINYMSVHVYVSCSNPYLYFKL